MMYGRWPKYVSVAQRRIKASKALQKMKKKGFKVEPIDVNGRKIARTFWGEAWCHHLEALSDYENRLPRGRTYVRNGSVCHLSISTGRIDAIVSGSELYNVKINIAALPAKKWKKVRDQCAGQIGSMLELLQGRFSDNVMKIVTDQRSGLFPQPGEIKLACNCPDWAEMCKHIAAVLYGVGARLDHQPELLFLLRDVDHDALIAAKLEMTSTVSGKGQRLATSDLSAVFGIDIDEPVKPVHKKTGRKKTTASKKSVITDIKKTVKKRAATTTEAKTKTEKKKKPFTPTAVAVRRLRKQFKMSSTQFAQLLEVTSPTVNNWENNKGKSKLKLRQHNLEALIKAAKLTPEQATKKLKIIERPT